MQMDLVREFAEKHGWTHNHILCSYDFVKVLMKSAKETNIMKFVRQAK